MKIALLRVPADARSNVGHLGTPELDAEFLLRAKRAFPFVQKATPPSLVELSGSRWQIVADDHEHHVDFTASELQHLEDEGTVAKRTSPAAHDGPASTPCQHGCLQCTLWCQV